MRLFQVAFLLSERSTFLASSTLHPPNLSPATTSLCLFHKLFLSSPHLQTAFQIFFLTTPFTSWRTDTGSKLWGNKTSERKKTTVEQLLFPFFGLNLYNLLCLRIIFHTDFGFYIKGPNYCIYWHSQKWSFKTDFFVTQVNRCFLVFWNKHCCLLLQEPAVSLTALLFKVSPKQIFIKLFGHIRLFYSSHMLESMRNNKQDKVGGMPNVRQMDRPVREIYYWQRG